jgi:UMF1 family MFS transporter
LNTGSPSPATTASSPAGDGTRAEQGGAGRSAILGWLLFDWACQPFFTLVTTFVFAPYFAAALAPNPIEGQSLWGFATAAAGLVLAVLSPVLGSIADATGPKKPWILACGLVLFASSWILWHAAPGAPRAIPIALVGFAVATVAVEVAAVFNNAMIPHLVPPEKFGRLSGTGWAIGYLGGLVSLVAVLGFLAANPETGRTFLGLDPLFGLDPAAREGDRVTGPFSAVWFLVFILPLFVFTPDIARSTLSPGAAVRKGLAQVRGTLADARRHQGLGRFLVANMVYQDALVALFAFGGIYGAGVFGWQAVELGVFGILLTVTGTLGALIGGRLDDRFGAKPVILGSILILGLVCLGVLSLGRDHILFVVPTAPAQAGDGLYGSAPEKMFLALGLVIGSVAGPMQASARSMLARLVPAREAGRYFGLLALSGKVTSFLAPLAVAVATDLFDTQAAGPAVLILFFLTGGFLLSGVRRV